MYSLFKIKYSDSLSPHLYREPNIAKRCRNVRVAYQKNI